jgi:glucose/arabinose dehydrogenase
VAQPVPRLVSAVRSIALAGLLLGLAAGPGSLAWSRETDGAAVGGARVPDVTGAADAARPPQPAARVASDAFTPSNVNLALTLVKGGFVNPLLVTNAGDNSHRLFVVEQAGVIRVIDAGNNTLPTPMLDLRGSITSGGERGLLGLAFDPQFPTLPYIYVNFTDRNGNTAISRYTIGSNPNVAVPSTGVRILTIPQPYSNHNGGNLAFGPDGFLYIGMGDGGSGGDPQNRAQNLSSLLGKMLRIDIHHGTSRTHYVVPASNPYVGRTGNDLIWSLGLRNPWRWSFDRATGNLWIGDVGQDRWEEIDRSVRYSSTRPAGRGVNYGWAVLEGRACFKPSSGCSTTGKNVPLAVYPHSASPANCSVTGGFVYRGVASPVLVGGYLFGDYCSGRIWAVSGSASAPATPTLLWAASASPHLLISSFGEDEAGELYVTDHAGGGIYRISGTPKA